MHDGKLTIIDLFAGAGGFSCGFEQTGAFKVILAVERETNYRKTYEENHAGLELMYGDILELINDRNLNKLRSEVTAKYGGVDVVIGGPPCQGFSKANRQRNHLISTNNMLVNAYIRFVDRLEPKAFVMENVADMPKYSFYVSSDPDAEAALVKSQVERQDENPILGNAGTQVALMLDFLNGHLEPNGVVKEPQCALFVDRVYPALRTLATHVRNKKQEKKSRYLQTHRTFFAKTKEALVGNPNDLPEHLRSRLLKWLSRTDFDIDDEEIISLTDHLGIVARLSEIARNRIKVFDFHTEGSKVIAHLQSYNLASHLEGFFRKKHYTVDHAILEATQFGVPQRRERVFFIGFREDLGVRKINFPKPLTADAPYSVRDAIEDLARFKPSYSANATPLLVASQDSDRPPLAQFLNGGTDLIFNHIQTQTTETALLRYRSLQPGQNFHALPDHLTSSYTNKERTQRNVYCRLYYDLPSLTVTNVRKAMWVHPQYPRAISVREAARLQSFPDSYRFHGRKNDQYQQVGNAVPPLLARAVAEMVAKGLGVDVAARLENELRRHPPLAHPSDTREGARAPKNQK